MTGAIYRTLNGSQTALLNVNVPAEAKVFINGDRDHQHWHQRQFVSRGLKAGNRYAYEVRAEFVSDGKPVTETKAVTLAPAKWPVWPSTSKAIRKIRSQRQQGQDQGDAARSGRCESVFVRS